MTTNLDLLIVELEGLAVDDLRAVWRTRLGAPPPVRSRDLLRRSLAEQLQLAAFGHDPELDRDLGRLTKRYRPGQQPQARKATFRAGSRLSRDWKGTRHTVEVVDGGFIWNGEHHDSLSKIARSITGVRWNGPRFFGLREAP
jgi:hypothetical protein